MFIPHNTYTKSAVESILFYSNTPRTLKELARIVGVSKDEVVNVVHELQKEYEE
jgi:chromosome segregation and condensation protein ScpB